METSAKIANIKCKMAEYFIQEMEQDQYMIEGCKPLIDKTSEYSLFIDLLENKAFLNNCCKIKELN